MRKAAYQTVDGGMASTHHDSFMPSRDDQSFLKQSMMNQTMVPFSHRTLNAHTTADLRSASVDRSAIEKQVSEARVLK